MEITKPVIIRLARKSGIKSLSDDCYQPIRDIINNKIHEIVRTLIIVNTEHQTKTLMIEDLYNSLKLLNINLTQTTEMGKTKCVK